jgi:hypothetical protein
MTLVAKLAQGHLIYYLSNHTCHVRDIDISIVLPPNDSMGLLLGFERMGLLLGFERTSLLVVSEPVFKCCGSVNR